MAIETGSMERGLGQENKRAQRSPEEKVKGQGKAIYRGPLIPNMKALGLVVSDKKIFENCILKTYFLTP